MNVTQGVMLQYSFAGSWQFINESSSKNAFLKSKPQRKLCPRSINIIRQLLAV